MKHFFSLLRSWQFAVVVLSMLVGPLVQAQTPVWQMATAATGDYSVVYAAEPDAAGNIFMTGIFQGTVSFGSTTFTSAGNYDVYVAKWSQATQSFVWAQRAGGISGDYATALSVSGNSIYIAGRFTAPSNPAFGNITLTNTNAFGEDLFVAKLTDNGNTGSFIWAYKAGGNSSVAADALVVSGTSVYLAGENYGPATFGTITLPGGGPFIAKLTDAGATASFTWAQQAGSNAQGVQAMAVNGGSIYITGSGGGISSPYTIGTATLPAGFSYIAKFTDAGNGASFAWAQGYNVYSSALAVSGPNVYVAGGFAGTATLGTTTLTSAGASDVFVAKFTDTGSGAMVGWAQRAGGTASDGCSDVVVKSTGVYITGSFSGATADFGNFSLTNAGGANIFLAKLTDAGITSNIDWALRAGGTDLNFGDVSTAVLLSGSDVYIAGSVFPPANFGGLTISTPTTNSVGFLARVNDPTLTATTAALRPESIGLFPNPAQGRATVQLPTTLGPATLTLLDALGRTLRTQAAPGPRAELDLSGLAPGLYAIRVAAGGSAATRRLVVK